MSAQLYPITVHVPWAKKKRLQELADAAGYTLHRYMQKQISEFASRAAPVEKHVHTLPSDANAERMTETVMVQVSLDIGMRLHSAARQMLDSSGKQVSPAWLCRQIVLHFTMQRSDIMERIQKEVDPAYVDHVPFQGRTTMRAGRTWYFMPIKCTLAGRNAIVQAAQHRGCSIAALVRDILNKVLPPLPQNT